MFKTRLLSGIVLVILALVLIITGKEVLLFSTLAISCIGMYELYRVFKIEKSLLAGLGYIAAIILLQFRMEFYTGYYDFVYGIYDFTYVCICICLSKISCK